MLGLSRWALTKSCVTVGNRVFELGTLLANHCAYRNLEESREECTFEIVDAVSWLLSRPPEAMLESEVR